MVKNKKIKVGFLLYLFFSSVQLYAYTLTSTESKEATAYNNGRRLARDSYGNLYVAINAHGKIKCFKYDGIAWQLKREYPQKKAKYPSIYIDKDPSIYKEDIHLVFSADTDIHRGCIFYDKNFGPIIKNLTKELNLDDPGLGRPGINTFYPTFSTIATAAYVSWSKIKRIPEWPSLGSCYYSPIEKGKLTTIVPPTEFLEVAGDQPPIISILGTSTINLIWTVWGKDKGLFHFSTQTGTCALSTERYPKNASAVVGLDDTLHVVWEETVTILGTPKELALMYAYFDKGTWSKKATISTTPIDEVKEGALWPSITQDINGTVYVVWAEKDKDDDNFYVFYTFKEGDRWKPKIKATHTCSAYPIYFVNVAQRSSELLIDVVYTTGKDGKYDVVYDNLKVVPSVMITEISPSGYVELHNTQRHPLRLENYKLNIWNVATVTLSGTINPHSSIIIATQATAFLEEFGYYPDFEVQNTVDSIPDVSLFGTFDILAAGGAILMYEMKDEKWRLIDVVAWGDGQKIVKGVYSIFSTATAISEDKKSLQRQVSFEAGIPIYRDTEFCHVDFYQDNYQPQTGGTIHQLKITEGNFDRIKAGEYHLFKLQTQNIYGAAIQESFTRTITFIVQARPRPKETKPKPAQIKKNQTRIFLQDKGDKANIDIYGSHTIIFSYYDECSGYQRPPIATTTAFEFKITGPQEWKREYQWQPATFGIYVEPAGLDHFRMFFSPPKPITYQPATFTIEGYDRFGNFQYDYTGTVTLECILTYPWAYPVSIEFATTTLRCITHYGTSTVGTPTYSPNMGVGTLKVWGYGKEGTSSAIFLINKDVTQKVHYVDNGTPTVILEVGTSTFNEAYYVCIGSISSPWPLWSHVGRVAYEIIAKNAKDKTIDLGPNKSATITFHYEEDTLTPVQQLQEADLQIFWWDEVFGVWKEVKKTYHSTITNTIKVVIQNLGKYVLGLPLKPADRLQEIIVFPNPYKAFEVKNRRIIFGNPHDQRQRLPIYSTIRIYNIAGELLYTIEAYAPEGLYEWKNPEDKLASGVYFYHVIAPDGSKCVGKFSIIK